MIMRKDLCQGLVSGLLMLAASSAYAVPVTYNFSITGIVNVLGTVTVKEYKSNGTLNGTLSSGPVANAFNLNVNDTITAYGTFTADSSYATSGGTVSFEQGTGNTLTINLKGTLLYASMDDSYPTGGPVGPTLTFNSGWALTDFDYQKLTAPKFNSSFSSFDDMTTSTVQSATSGGKYTITTTQSMYGTWNLGGAAVSAVPEASTYAMMLAGLGLVGMMGAARRKSLALPA